MAEQSIVVPDSTDAMGLVAVGGRFEAHRCVSYAPDSAWFLFFDEDPLTGSTRDELRAIRTTDAGASWINNTQLIWGESGFPGQTIYAISMWYDGWTRGVTGDDIHIVAIESDNPPDVRNWYVKLGATSGTATAPANMVAWDMGVGSRRTSIVKHTDDVLYVLMIAGDNDTWLVMKNDGSWASDGGGVGSFGSWPGVTPVDIQWCQLLPGWNGPMLIAVGATTSGHTLMYGEWNGTTFDYGGTIQAPDTISNDRHTFHGISAIERHDDGNIFVAYAKGIHSSNPIYNELVLAKITGPTSHQIMASPIIAPSAGPDGLGDVTLFCDQQLGWLYCGYERGILPASVAGCDAGIFYKYSADGGQTWSLEYGYTTSPDRASRHLSGPYSNPQQEDGDFFMTFTDTDLGEWQCADFLPIEGYKVRDLDLGGGDQREVDCTHGNPEGGGGPSLTIVGSYPNNEHRFITNTRGPAYQQSMVIWIAFEQKVGDGTHNGGDLMKGRTSGATGTLAAYLEDVNMMGITNVVPGEQDTPFLPNELIDNLTSGGHMVTASKKIHTSQPDNSSIGDKYAKTFVHAE